MRVRTMLLRFNLFIVLFLYITVEASAQFRIDGANSVNLYDTKTYYLIEDPEAPGGGQQQPGTGELEGFMAISGVYWSTTKGTIQTSNNTEATVYWNQAGAGMVTAMVEDAFGNFYWPERSVNIAPISPPAPAAPMITSSACGKSVITRGTPPPGITWYWQGTDANGTSVLEGEVNYDVFASGTYYLRAIDDLSEVWSVSSASVSVTVQVAPSLPSAPLVTNNCGNTVLTRSSPPSGITYYWQSSSAGTSTSNSSGSITLTSGSVYYLRARNNSTGCWGSTRTINYGVNHSPATPPVPAITNNCGNTVLTRSNPPSGITYYWQNSSAGTSTSNSSSSVTLTSGSVYYLRARNNSNGCWGITRTINYGVNHPPATPPVPAITNNCGNTVLTRSNPPSGTTYYWQSSSAGTSISNSSGSVTLTSGSVYYLRARNNSTGCWGSTRTVNYGVNHSPATPPVPAITNNCGNTVLTRSNPPSGITYYWQSSSTGTSTSSSSSSVTLTSGSVYYLRARNNSTGCWGSVRTVNYGVNHSPATPPVPAITNNCGNTVLTRSNPPSGITYYWQSSSTGTSISSSSSSVTLTSGSVYYLRARNNSTGCWSDTRTVTYSLNSIPSAPQAPSVVNYFGSSSLQPLTAPAGVAYYWQGTNTNGTSMSHPASSSYNTTTSGTYYVRGRSVAGCWGSSTAVSVSIESNPSIMVMGNTHLEALGDKVTLTVSGTYDSYSWKKDGVQVGTGSSYVATLAGSYTLTVTKSGISATGNTAAVVVTGCGDIDAGDENYVISTAILKEDVTVESAIGTLTSDDRSVSIQYFDGLGRALQTVSLEASPGRDHIVQPFTYDDFGRQTREYLPYVVTDNCGILQSNPVGTGTENYTSSPQYQFYQVTPGIAHDTAPYAERVFENSPLNRVLKQGAPGSAWQPVQGSSTDNVVDLSYGTNGAGELIRAFQVGLSVPVPSVEGGYYTVGEIFKNATEDEDGNEVLEYSDKLGRTILKRVETGDVQNPWADTYYVYDDLGNLRIVLPPEASKAIDTNSLDLVPSGYTLVTEDLEVDASNYTGGSYMYVEGASVTLLPGVTLSSDVEVIPYGITGDFLDQWAFRYEYDGRNRMIAKKVPGAGWVYMTYDRLDRLVLTQDANQRLSNQWTFTKYDVFNRPVLTGFYTNTTATTQAAMQALIDSHQPLNELTGSAVLGYTNNAFPQVSSANDYLTATYYDDYNMLTGDFSFNYVQEIGNPVHFTSLKGQVVGSKTKLLDGSNTWLKTVMYYDDRYRVLQTVADNHLGGIDRTSTHYDFSGRVLETKTTHSNGSLTTTINEDLVYDHASRLLEVSHQVNSDPAVVLVKNEYNTLGELVDKKLHSTDAGANFEQSVDYQYNIRGWLTHINDAGLTDGEGDYFRMELGYNELLSGLSGTTNYNGNISGAKWSNAGSGYTVQSAYKYGYDKLNRITLADYHEKEGTGSWNDMSKFNLDQLNYDLNGNIQTLRRYHTNTTTAMDQLVYSYSGNRLMSVTDNGDDAEGFKDGNPGINDYTYDANGNMKADHNKDITAISYNHLNLPQTVTFTGNRSITYTYDAAGIKLAKVADDNGTVTTIDYVSGFIYEDDVLQQLAHAEGRVRRKSTGDMVYDYYLKDHLGNTRITFTTEDEEVTYLATMETDTNGSLNYQTYEESLFLNLPATRDNSVTAANKSQESGIVNDESARLRGTDPARQIGPGKLLEVMPGDVVDLEVFYYHTGGYSDNGPVVSGAFLANLLTLMSGAAALASESQAVINAVNENSALVFVGVDGSDTGPRAYLNYILFDRDFDYEDADFDQVGSTSTTASGPQAINRSVTIEKKGYIYVYVSNESNSNFDVFFDDLRITHHKSRILQEDHYYPFGLQIAALSSQAPLSKPNKYNTFQGQERTEDFDLGWYQYKWRNHDPTIGRFFNVDPLAEKFYYNSVYAFSENKVTAHVELEGLESIRADAAQMLRNAKVLSGVNGRSQSANYNLQREMLTDDDPEAAKIMLGFTPIGPLIDIWDFAHAANDGNGTGMLTAGIGFLPFGDFAKLAKAGDEVAGGAGVLSKNADKLGAVRKLGLGDADVDDIMKWEVKASPEEADKIWRIKEGFKNGDAIPAIDVVQHNGQTLLVDGHHRLAAARELGMKNIKVNYLSEKQAITMGRAMGRWSSLDALAASAKWASRHADVAAKKLDD